MFRLITLMRKGHKRSVRSAPDRTLYFLRSFSSLGVQGPRIRLVHALTLLVHNGHMCGRDYVSLHTFTDPADIPSVLEEQLAHFTSTCDRLYDCEGRAFLFPRSVCSSFVCLLLLLVLKKIVRGFALLTQLLKTP